MLRFGKAKMEGLRATARAEGGNALAVFVSSRMSAREHKTVRELQRKLQPEFEPITDAQYAVLEKAAPKVRGKVFSSILESKNDRPV